MQKGQLRSLPAKISSRDGPRPKRWFSPDPAGDYICWSLSLAYCTNQAAYGDNRLGRETARRLRIAATTQSGSRAAELGSFGADVQLGLSRRPDGGRI